MTAWPYWPAPAGLADEATVALGLAADRLTVGDLRLAHVGRHLELAGHAVHEDVQVQLAHAGDEGLPGLFVGLDAEGGVLLGQALQGHGKLVLVGLRLGLDGDLDDRLGKDHRLEDDRVARVGQRVAGEGVLEPHGGGDVAGVRPPRSPRGGWRASARIRPMRSRRSLVALST